MVATSFEDSGFVITEPLFDQAAVDQLERSVEQISLDGAGARDLLQLPWCAEWARLIRTQPSIAPLLPADAVAVQCTFFRKSKDQNWLVPLHQDLSIPVRERVADEGLTGWSDKDGTLFVQPPGRVLEQMVGVRLHIDACGVSDGPLRVVPASHKFGRLAAADALLMRERLGEIACAVERGGALVLRPLLLHASSKATGDSQRRVLHFVFGPRSLPGKLAWQTTI